LSASGVISRDRLPWAGGLAPVGVLATQTQTDRVDLDRRRGAIVLWLDASQ
jgi:hypothetical protein